MHDTVTNKLTILCLFLLVVLGMAHGAQAAVTITRTSSPVFYADITNGLTDMYAAYRITTDTAITDGWAEIGSFSGLNISLSSHEDGLYHLGPMAAGSSRMVYFYLHTAGNFTGAESHTVSLYDGKPPSGGLRGSQSFSLTQADTIQALASKVSSVITGPTPATLGGVVTMVITGETGTTNGPMAYTPASDTNWLADTYELFSTTVSLPNGTVLNDQPYVATYSGTTGTFVVTYKFVAKGAAAAPSAGSPANYIQSGGLLKHAPTGTSAGTLPPPPIDPTFGNATVVSKLADTTILPPGSGGNVTYTIRFSNSGTIDITLDDIVDTLPTSPAMVSYLQGTSKFNGVAIANPTISGAQLTWSGAFVVPALSSRDLVFQAAVPGTAGTYVNSAVAHIGTTLIDTTIATTDNAPASFSISVTSAATLTKAFTPATIGTGGQSTLTFTIANGPGNPAQSDLGFTDLLPANVTVVGTPTTPQCGGTVSYNAGTNSLVFSGGSMAAGTASCAINATVTSSVPGTYVNAYNSNAALSNISNVTGGLNPSGASGTLQVSAPTLSKAFAPNTINANQVSDLIFTVANGPGNPVQSTLAFTDTLPSGVVIVTPPVTSTTCNGGVFKAGTSNPLTGGETALTFSGGTLAAGTASCTVSVRVRPSSGTLTTYTNGATNMSNLSAGLVNGVSDQTLTIVSTPTLTKAFTPSTIGVNAVPPPGSSTTYSTLTFTINNPANKAQNNLSFTDLFPAGLVVAVPTGVTSSCGGNVYRVGTSTPLTGGEAAMSFVGGSVSASSSCTVSVRVTSATEGSYTNSSVNITQVGGLSNAAAPSTLTVAGTTLSKSFGVPIIISGTTTPMTFTITNNSGDPAQSGFGFTDQLPAGLTVSAAPASPQCGGTVSYTAASNTLSFSGGTLPLGTHSCSLAATVTSSTPGIYTNDSSRITASTGGLNTSAVTATLAVVTAPTITVSKALTPPGRTAAADQFTVQIKNGSGTVVGSTAASTTTGSGSTVTAGTGTSSYTAASLGESYTLNEVMAGGSSSTLAQYLTTLSCTNNGVAVPALTAPGQSFTPVGGDNYVCTISNAPRPTVQVQKVSSNGTGTFAFAGTNGVAASFSLTTATAGTPVASSVYPVTSTSSSVTISETAPAGWPANPTSASCTDANGAASGNGAGSFGSLAGNVLTIPSANLRPGAQILCSFVNTATATVTVAKILVPASDSGRFNLLAGAATLAADIGDAGTGSTTVPANTAVTVSETAGTGTSLADYTSSYSCSNGISGSGTSVSITPATGENVTCTFTNSRSGVSVSGAAYSDANHNGTLDGGEQGTGQTLYVKLAPRSGTSCGATATATAAADTATGAYLFPFVPTGDYCLILDDSAALDDTVPASPAGWLGTENPTGIIAVTVEASPLTGRNYGLYNGSRLSGRVFSDIGTGAGGVPNNGIQDGNEAGTAGTSVRITDNSGGTTYDSSVTDGSGNYTLWLPAAAGNSSVKVVETNPAGQLSTGGNPGTTNGSYDRATDTTTFTNTVGTSYSGVTFADVPANSFADNNSGTVVAGGTIYYPHTFIAGSGGAVTFSSSATATPAMAGWSELFYQDSNCNGSFDAGEPQISGPMTVTAAQQFCLLLKESAPAGATAGATNAVTVSALFDYVNALPALSVIQPLTDLTTILQSGLTLMKFVDKAAAKPGETLVYTITYANTGFGQLSNIIISDPVPAYTTLTVPASGAACCVGPAGDCLGTPATPFPAAITACTPTVTSSSVTWTLGGTLSPGSSGQVKFSVTIDQ